MNSPYTVSTGAPKNAERTARTTNSTASPTRTTAPACRTPPRRTTCDTSTPLPFAIRGIQTARDAPRPPTAP